MGVQYPSNSSTCSMVTSPPGLTLNSQTKAGMPGRGLVTMNRALYQSDFYYGESVERFLMAIRLRCMPRHRARTERTDHELPKPDRSIS